MQDLTVKVGDFGLTRDTEQGEYYRMTGSAPLPVRRGNLCVCMYVCIDSSVCVCMCESE
jgi:hypothetical protein